MLLLCSPRSGRPRRASLLLLAVVAVCAAAASARLQEHHRCLVLGCAIKKRFGCSDGSSQCGPCLDDHVEHNGKCVSKRKSPHEVKYASAPSDQSLDAEIDYLRTIIEKQVVSESRTTKQRNKHPAAAALQSDARNSQSASSAQNQRNEGRVSDGDKKNTTLAPPPISESKVTAHRAGPVATPTEKKSSLFIILTSLLGAVGLIAVVMATVCFVKIKKESRLAQKVDYPAFKGSGPPAATGNGTTMGDNKLAQSAQMYHYQHQKQQMLSVGSHKPEQKTVDTEVTSDEEEVGGDFTVYECPGLAPTGEMEVKNPLFDDSTLHFQGNQN